MVEKAKTIIIVILVITTIGGGIGTFIFKQNYDQLMFKINNVEPDKDVIALKEDLDRIQNTNEQISIELDIVRIERDNAERLEALAIERSQEVNNILNNALREYNLHETASEKLSALLLAIQKAAKKAKEVYQK
jgi:uncharacterized protein (DUF3084 family)